MLRVTIETDRLVRLEGRFVRGESAIDALTTHRAGGPFTLDLSGVTAMDAEARRFLIHLRRDACPLVGASLYIQHLLAEA